MIGVCFCLCFCVPFVAAQTPGDMESDPHYTLLLKNEKVRVFELSLTSSQQVFVQQNHNFMMIMLQDCEVVIWREGESAIQNFPFKKGDIRFLFGGHAYGIRNDRNGIYRNITIEFLDPKITSWGYQYQTGTWDYGVNGIQPPVDPHAKFMSSARLGDIMVSDVQLLAGDSYPSPEKPTAELLVPVTDVDLKAGKGQHIRKSSGEVVWTPAEQQSRFVNAGSDPARFVALEFPAATP